MTEKICVIGGTNLFGSNLFNSFKKVSVKNKYGKVILYRQNNIFYIQRHQGNATPHKINYKAYLQALADKKVKKIIAVNSVGSLKKNIKPGSLLVPHDFIAPWQIPTFFENEIKHVTPSFCPETRKLLIKTIKDLKYKIYDKGVYFQATGPRLETPAEINMFANFGDVVGMTLASETVLANEKGISLASICTIDNYGNGLIGSVDYKKIKDMAGQGRTMVEKILKIILHL